MERRREKRDERGEGEKEEKREGDINRSLLFRL